MDPAKRRKGERVRQWFFGKRSKATKEPPSRSSTAPTTQPVARDLKASDRADLRRANSAPESDTTVEVFEKPLITPPEAQDNVANNGAWQSPPTAAEDLWVRAMELLSEDDRQLLESNVRLGPTLDILNQMQEVVDDKQRMVEEKAWKLDFRGRRIVLRDVMGKIAGWVSAFKDVGEFIATADPVHCALPWAAVKVVLSVTTADLEQAGQLLIGIELVTSLINRCNIYEQLYILQGHMATHLAIRELQKSVVSTYKSVLSFLVSYIRLMDRNTFTRTMVAAVDLGATSQLLADLGKWETQCEVAANNCERSIDSLARQRQDSKQREMEDMLKGHIRNFDANVNKFWRKLKDEERCQIFQWISPIPFETDHYNATKGRVEGTGQWLIDHETYRQWKSKDCSTILWLNGIPGAGKTKLSSKVIDDLLQFTSKLETDESFAYFYCDRNRTDHSDPVVTLRSLVRQLSASRDESTIIPYVEAKYTERKRSGFARDELTSEECQDLLLRLASDYSKCNIVIDGLDECDRETRHVLMDVLDSLVAESVHPVKVYIASRQDQDLRDRYQSGDHLEITANDNQADIEKFVLNKLEQSPFCRTKMSKKVRQEILKTFNDKSQGMFQWAALHIDELLKLNRNKDILSYLDKLPRGLEAAYKKIFNNIASQPGSKRDVAFAAFKILMCNWRLLSPTEMVIAATQDLGEEFAVEQDLDITYVLDACHNFMVVADGLPEGSQHDTRQEFDPTSGKFVPRSKKAYADIPHSKYRIKPFRDGDVVAASSGISVCRFAHLSVREFLELHHWSVSEANAYMACLCLRTLLRLQWNAEPIVDDEEPHQDADEESDGSDEESHPWLRFEMRERRRLSRIYWDDSEQSSVASDEESTTSKYPPFNCILEAYSSHHHDDRSVCESVDFDTHIEEFSGTAVEKWTGYASETWILHVRQAAQHESLREKLDELLRGFLGEPHASAAQYRAWTIFNRGNTNLTIDNPGRPDVLKIFRQKGKPDFIVRVEQGVFHPVSFPRYLLRPTTNATLGCAMLGIDYLLKEWLESGAINANDTNARGDSLLHLAIRGSHYKACETLLLHGADPNILAEDKYSPLQFAVIDNRPDIVKILLKHGANPNQPPLAHLTGYVADYPLRTAVTFGYYECTKLLLESGADLYESKAFEGATRGNLKTARLLLDRLAQEAAGASDDHSSVQNAIEKAWLGAIESDLENTDILNLFLNRGIDMEALDSMHLAAAAGNMSSVRWLISQGFDINQKSKRRSDEETPLMKLARASTSITKPRLSSVAKEMVAAGARLNDTNLEGNTPLLIAVKNGFRELAETLIDAGADVRVRDARGETVLIAACLHGLTNVISKLLDLGLDVNEDAGPDGGYVTPLYAAHTVNISSISQNSMCLLLEAGAKYKEEDFTAEQRESMGQLDTLESRARNMVRYLYKKEEMPWIRWRLGNKTKGESESDDSGDEKGPDRIAGEWPSITITEVL